MSTPKTPNSTNEKCTSATLLRDWDDEETPIAVPVYPLCNAYPVRELAASFVNMSRLLSDQMQYITCQDSENEQDQNCVVESQNEDDWLVVSQVVQGRLVDDHDEECSEISESQNERQNRRGIFKKLRVRRKSLNSSVKECLYKLKVRAENKKHRFHLKFRQMNDDTDDNDTTSVHFHPIVPQHKECVSDNSMGSQIEESIRKKIKQLKNEELVAKEAKRQNRTGDDGKTAKATKSPRCAQLNLNDLKIKITEITEHYTAPTTSEEPAKTVNRVSPFSSAIYPSPSNEIVVNDTLKLMFVGKEDSGKTSLIRGLLDGKPNTQSIINDEIDEAQPVGVDIYDWSPDGNIRLDGLNIPMGNDVNIKFNLWDFTCQRKFHTCQELFYTQCALYVIVWDMGAKIEATWPKKKCSYNKGRSFNIDFSDDYEECLDDIDLNSDRYKQLNDDIDENVQFWIETIQRKAPGSSILIVGSHTDLFDNDIEAKLRYEIMRRRVSKHEEKEMERVFKRISNDNLLNGSKMDASNFVHNLCQHRPTLLFGLSEKKKNNSLHVSNTKYTGFDDLKTTIIQLATGHASAQNHKKLFSNHVGVGVPASYGHIKEIIRDFRKKRVHVIERNYLNQQLMLMGITDTQEINDALHFLTNVGELMYYGHKNIKECLIGSSTSLFYNYEDVKEKTNCKLSPELNDYIILNPRWLIHLATSILQPNFLLKSRNPLKESAQRFDNVINPTVPYEDMKRLLAESAPIRKATNLIKDKIIRNGAMSPQDFFMQLLLRYDIFVPIGVESRSSLREIDAPRKPMSIFLPTLLQSIEPNDDLFTHKSSEASEMSLCHSWLFPDYFSLPIMEKIIASLLSTIRRKSCHTTKDGKRMLGKEEIKEHFFWRNSFYLNLGNVKFLVRMAKHNSRMCVGSCTMSPGMSRITVSAKGSALDAGKLIWNGGFRSVKDVIEDVMREFPGLEYKEQYVCPRCLGKSPIQKAHCWDTFSVKNAIRSSHKTLNCGNAHSVDVSCLSGLYSEDSTNEVDFSSTVKSTVKANDLFGSVVLVCGYDEDKKQIVRAGSGFIMDKKRGLILTAAHTLIDLSNRATFGQQCDKVVIGMIPDARTKSNGPLPAVFRYTARIIAKDPLLSKKKVCAIDACILQIVSKFETDVHCSHDLYKVPEMPLTKRGIKKENLSALELQEECEIEERVRIIGFNQGGENIVEEGAWLFRNIGCTPGIVNAHHDHDFEPVQVATLCPKREIVITCDSIVGESGGPCINDNGEVVGILSRGHRNRSYLVPIRECMELPKETKIRMYS